jgi:excisionase family DNA binding protein
MYILREEIMQQQELLTVAEVARILRLHPQTIRTWIKSGTMEGVRIGPKKFRVARGELERVLNGEPVAVA